MKVLQISANYLPNIGGVETHLFDLGTSLLKRNWSVFVLSYRPLSVKTKWRLFESSKNFTILRIPWLRGFFEKFIQYPILEFIYLVPGLFIMTPLVIVFFKPNVIHAHGLISAVPALFWGKIFNKRIIVSLHNIYSFSKEGRYPNFVKKLLSNCDFVLSLSKKSFKEMISLGIKRSKLDVFTYWVDLNKFVEIPQAKANLDLNYSFTVLFVGRLVIEKGIKELVEAATSWNKKIHLIIAGTGPLEGWVSLVASRSKNIHFLRGVEQNKLPKLYSAVDLLIVPSVSEEGFGRVIIESLACSTPVIASNRGSIPEALDTSVGRLIEITPKGIRKCVEYFYLHPNILKKLSKNARKFAERRYSEKNVERIIRKYTI